MKTEVYRTKRMAFSAAKDYFAVRLDIKHDSVHVTIVEKTSTQCDCGETEAFEFQMNNAGPKRLERLKPDGGNSVTIGVCKNCGKEH